MKPHEFQVGDLAYLYEIKRGKTKKPQPVGQGLLPSSARRSRISGWLEAAGATLAASEHLRAASPEEVGETMKLKMAMKEVKKLIEHEVSESEEMEIDESYFPDGEAAQPNSSRHRGNSCREAALRQAVKRNHLLDDLPASLKKPRQAHQVFMAKRCVSQKGKEKQLEKELPCGQIPPDERETTLSRG